MRLLFLRSRKIAEPETLQGRRKYGMARAQSTLLRKRSCRVHQSYLRSGANAPASRSKLRCLCTFAWLCLPSPPPPDILAITDGAGAGSKLVGDGMSPAVAAATKYVCLSRARRPCFFLTRVWFVLAAMPITFFSNSISCALTPRQGNMQQLALVQQAQKDRNTLATRAPVMPKPAWHPKWKLMRVISGHLGWVRACVVEPGNKWFATGAADRVIKIWDMASGTLKLTLTGHISTVRGLAVSPRHPYLFSVAEDKMVKCWDLECNKVIRHYHGHLRLVAGPHDPKSIYGQKPCLAKTRACSADPCSPPASCLL